MRSYGNIGWLGFWYKLQALLFFSSAVVQTFGLPMEWILGGFQMSCLVWWFCRKEAFLDCKGCVIFSQLSRFPRLGSKIPPPVSLLWYSVDVFNIGTILIASYASVYGDTSHFLPVYCIYIQLGSHKIVSPFESNSIWICTMGNPLVCADTLLIPAWNTESLCRSV